MSKGNINLRWPGYLLSGGSNATYHVTQRPEQAIAYEGGASTHRFSTKFAKVRKKVVCIFQSAKMTPLKRMTDVVRFIMKLVLLLLTRSRYFSVMPPVSRTTGRHDALFNQSLVVYVCHEIAPSMT